MPESSPISTPVVENFNTSLSQTVKTPTKPRKPILIILVLILLFVGAAVFAFIWNQRGDQLRVLDNGNSSLLKDRVFVRYEENGAYEKDSSTGEVKKITDAKGNVNSIRKKTFEITLEKNGTKHPVILDDKTIEFGATTDNKLYSISCSVAEDGMVGADNASFTVQFYDQDGNKTKQANWKEQDTTRPADLGNDCQSNYFSIRSNRVDFAARNYGRELVDDLNYKLVFVKNDGSKQDVDIETTADINIPLGPTPDKKLFLYNRISAKRLPDGCGGPITELPYKVVDFSGPINELHAVDLLAKKDTLIGTEKSFSATDHQINLSHRGDFSKDSARYYLVDVGSVGHGGCSDGNIVPIRIPYIDLKTNKLETISSPDGKEYSNYCFNENVNYILESGVVDDYDDATPAKTPAAPTVLNIMNSTVYQDNNLTDGFGCESWLPNTFMKLDTTADETEEEHTYSLLGFSTFDPATKAIQKTTLKTPVLYKSVLFLKGSFISSIQKTGAANVGYINRDRVEKTVLFNAKTGEIQEVDYAQLVL